MDKYLNKITAGDCKELLQDLPDDSIDLVVTSPPYDNLRTYQGYDFDFGPIALRLSQVIKPGGVIVWVVGDAVVNGSETGTSFRQALAFMGFGLNLHDTMIYEKNGAPHPDKLRYFQVFEYMFVFSKGRPSKINLLADRKNKWEKHWGERTIRNKDGKLQKRNRKKYTEFGVRFNIWRFNSGKGFSTKDKIAHQHPAIFPEKLARDHITSWSNPGDIVLDPMCGSGTTCKMAKESGRQYIGFDISEEYCELARKRIAGANVPLFVTQ